MTALSHPSTGSEETLVTSGSRRRRFDLLSEPKVRIGLVLLVPLLVAAAVSLVWTPYPPRQLGVGPPLSPPSLQFWFGTDLYGRDYFSRILVGSQTSVLVAVVVGLGALLIGLPLGAASGFFGGRTDLLSMRAADVVLSIPWLLIALFLAAVLGFGLSTVLIALVIVFSPQLARVARNAVLTVRNREYVLAARSIGEGSGSVLVRYVLPNSYFPILVLMTSMMGYAILGEAAVSYLGVGVQPPDTSWGLELSEAQTYISSAPYLSIFPGLAIAIFVFGLNFLGDGLGDHLGRIGQRR
jgi:peptide/nickel transport system permease protein